MRKKCSVFKCHEPANRKVMFKDYGVDPLLVIQLCVEHKQEDYFDSIPQREKEENRGK